MVFYPFTEEAASWPTMPQVMKLICDEGNIDAEADTVMHFGKMDCAAKNKILVNINEHWQRMVVMTNNSATAGLNFNPKDAGGGQNVA